MKANEAPETIYFTSNENGTCYYTEGIPFEREYIEYICKDAFIEKACEWLKENFSFDEAGYCRTNIFSVKSMIYNFKNTLGGKL